MVSTRAPSTPSPALSARPARTLRSVSPPQPRHTQHHPKPQTLNLNPKPALVWQCCLCPSTPEYEPVPEEEQFTVGALANHVRLAQLESTWRDTAAATHWQ
eukprot:1644053-Rhodomonas_salina.1